MSDGSPGRAHGAAELLAGRRICVCVGAGGVGKTTTAATLALGMAMRGQKVVVVTIDPARRLAEALGLETLDNEPQRVYAGARAEAPGGEIPELRGELWAVMLDPKRTFDELIDSVAPSPERAAEIKRNGVYRQLSGAVAGSQEFTAIEKLYELAAQDYDLLVLDTPPAHNATEFLNAPGRLTAFLGGGALQALIRPTGLGLRLLGAGATPLLGALRLVTGASLLTDLTSFLTLIGGMTAEFTARAARVEELLRASTTGFVLVTTAQDRPVKEAIQFRETLRANHMPFLGTIVNRVTPALRAGAAALPNGALPAELAERLLACARDHAVLAGRDRANIQRLREGLGEQPLLIVPDLAERLTDVGGLLAMREELFDD
jgi:anion-transporting  ArsA/GET3 family ATPase